VNSIWIGYEPREAAAFAVARHSIRQCGWEGPINGIVLSDLRQRKLYQRPTAWMDNQMWDPISGAPMSTEFAISRFFTPMLAKTGWALFMDCDFLIRHDIGEVFDNLDPAYAIYCVWHNHAPEGITKMDGMTQTKYARKNWSSFCIYNCDHPSNVKLTLSKLNKWPGRDLHAFKWLQDDEIGELSPTWNYLVGVNHGLDNPKCVHFTLGTPDMQGYDKQPFADEWYATLEDWALNGQ